MKIIFTADLHYPTTDSATLIRFVEKIKAEKPDILVLGGDLGESLRGTKNFLICLEIFTSRFDIPVLVIAGNHDLWRPEESSINSLHLWKTLLPSLTERAGAIWLEGANYYAGSIAIVGSYLHYDYSAADNVGPAVGLAPEYWDFHKMTSECINRRCTKFGKKIKYDNKPCPVCDSGMGSFGNNDGRFLRGLPSDVEFAREIGDSFKARLEEAQLSPDTKEIIVATHVPIVDEQVTRNPHDYEWAMGTPYLGCLSYDHWIDACSKISHLVCGHNHRYKEDVFYRGDGSGQAWQAFMASTLGREKNAALRDAGITMKGNEVFSGTPRAICCGADYRKPEFVAIETKF